MQVHGGCREAEVTFLSFPKVCFCSSMCVCNMTKVSTHLLLHMLGNWDCSIIHDLSRTPVPDIEDVSAGVSEKCHISFGDSQQCPQLAALTDQPCLCSAVGLQERAFLIKIFIA